ncbi:DUF72 domain-containing protein [Acidobacteriota bacterium]
MNKKIQKDLGDFHFRNIHPDIFLGTCSDRYAGWIGQVYNQERYGGRINSRTRVLAGKTYYEEVLPVDSVIEYFQHFPLLELDFTFYRPLLDSEGKPTSNYHVLTSYRQHFKDTDRVIIKVPQAVIARKLRRGQKFITNPNYLDADFFVRSFYDPAVEILGSHLCGFIFEQEYQRKNEQENPEMLAVDLSRFFYEVPQDDRYHIEIRTGRLLGESLFEALRPLGIGQVLSHWTWLPTLEEQFEKSGNEVLNRDGIQVIRLLTPRNMNYTKSFDKAFPFNRMVDGLLRDNMLDDTVKIIKSVIHQGKRIFILINNRFGGNAPQTGRILVERLEADGVLSQ